MMALHSPRLAYRAWDGLRSGTQLAARSYRLPGGEHSSQQSYLKHSFHSLRLPRSQISSAFEHSRCLRQRTSIATQAWSAKSQTVRFLNTTRVVQEEQATVGKPKAYRDEVKTKSDPADEEDSEDDPFKRTERANQASKIDLSAKLSSDSSEGKGGGGLHEVARLLRIVRPEIGTLSVAFTLLLISSAVTMSVPFSIGKIMDAATQAQATMFGLPMEQFYVALVGLLACGAMANFGRIVILRIVGERVVTKLRSQLFKRTFVQNAEFFDANRVGDLISRLGNDTIIVGKSITQNVSDGLRSLVSAAAGLTMMLYVSAKLTTVLAVFIPPIGIVAFFYGRAIRNLSRRIQKNLGTLTKIAEERLGNVRTSQAFVGEMQEVHRYNTQVRKIFGLGRREAFLSATFFSSSGFMGNLLFIALLYVGGGMVQSSAISIGDLTSFLMYAGYAGSSLFGLSSFYSELMKGTGAASRLFELQDREPTISPTKGDMIKSARGAIEFKDVQFSYPTRPAVKIFEDLSFRIEQGSNVAIVAPSGAGKSTVASLLLRFYAPTSGTISISGKDISTMNAKQLRRKIGYVGQEPVLFSGTIAENISYGRPLATKAEIVTAARQANCQFISDFPDGLDTFVGARGTQLSGGQKQRIAIARALLKNPDILILDEATSALDAESETLVNQALHRLLQSQNTTISIAHRLSTIQRSDSLICIGSDGKVAQVGSYADLAADKEGAFAKLMEWQMSGAQEAAIPATGQIIIDETAAESELTEEERMKAKLEERDRAKGIELDDEKQQQQQQSIEVSAKDGARGR